jgi:hypothetical protein
VKQALKQLLNALDEISKEHPEVSDLTNREAVTKAIYQGFVLWKDSYKLPARFGMLSTEGNSLVREALAAFLSHPDAAYRSKDLTPDARRTAFQDASVVSSLGHRCHHYFDAHILRRKEHRKAFAQKLLPPKGHLPPYPRKKNYQTGDWFGIPLRTKGFGLGLVARDKRGQCLGYFFGPLRLSMPSLVDCAGLTSADAEFVQRFSDYHIRVGYWPKLGMLPGWNKEDWPMPVFASTLLGYFAAHYPDDDPSVDPNLVASTEKGLRSLPEDSFAGSGAVEIRLTMLLDAAAYEAMRR